MECNAMWSDILIPMFWRNLLPPSSGFCSQMWATVYWNVGTCLPDCTVLSQKTGMFFICCHMSLILKPYKVWRFRSSQMWHSVNGWEGSGTLYSHNAFILRLRQSKNILFGIFDTVDEAVWSFKMLGTSHLLMCCHIWKTWTFSSSAARPW